MHISMTQMSIFSEIQGEVPPSSVRASAIESDVTGSTALRAGAGGRKVTLRFKTTFLKENMIESYVYLTNYVSYENIVVYLLDLKHYNNYLSTEN